MDRRGTKAHKGAVVLVAMYVLCEVQTKLLPPNTQYGAGPANFQLNGLCSS